MAISFNDWKNKKNGDGAVTSSASQSDSSIGQSGVQSFSSWRNSNPNRTKEEEQRRIRQANQNAAGRQAASNRINQIRSDMNNARTLPNQVLDYANNVNSARLNGTLNPTESKNTYNKLADIVSNNKYLDDQMRAKLRNVLYTTNASVTPHQKNADAVKVQTNVPQYDPYSFSTGKPIVNSNINDRARQTVNTASDAYKIGLGADLSGLNDAQIGSYISTFEDKNRNVNRANPTGIDNPLDAAGKQDVQKVDYDAVRESVRNSETYQKYAANDPNESILDQLTDAMVEKQMADNAAAVPQTAVTEDQNLWRKALNNLYNERDTRNFNNTYEPLRYNEDFETNSAYDDSITDTLYQNANAEEGTPSPYWAGNVKYKEDIERYMTEDELKMFNYVYKTQGRDAAMEYYSGIEPSLNARHRENLQSQTEDFLNEGWANQVLGSGISVLMKPFNLINDVASMGYQLATGDHKIDPNSPAFDMSAIGDTTRSTVNQNLVELGGGEGTLGGDLLGLAYDAGMSTLDNLYGIGIGSQVAELAGLSGKAFDKVAEAVVLGLMGTDSAKSTTLSLMDEGLSQTDAIIMGLASGGIETITEKIGLDNLFESMWRGKKAWTSWAKQVLSEGSEEILGAGMNDAFGLMYDQLRGLDVSDISREVNQYMLDNGLGRVDENAAFAHVMSEHLKDAGKAGLAGGLSGGMLGGKEIVQNKLQVNRQSSLVTKNEISDLFDSALSLNTNSDAYKAAAKMVAELGGKVENGKAVGLPENYADSITDKDAQRLYKNLLNDQDYLDNENESYDQKKEHELRTVNRNGIEKNGLKLYDSAVSEAYDNASSLEEAELEVRKFYTAGFSGQSISMESSMLSQETATELFRAGYLDNVADSNQTIETQSMEESGPAAEAETQYTDAEIDQMYQDVTDVAERFATEFNAPESAQVLMDNYQEATSADEYISAMQYIAEQVENGLELKSIEASDIITEEAKTAMYEAVLADMKGENYGREEVPLPGISRRNDVQDSGRTRTGMAEETGRTSETGYNTRTDERNAEISQLKTVRAQVSLAELGISNADPDVKVDVVDNNSNADLRAAAENAARNGLELIAFTGDYIKVNGESVNIRGAYTNGKIFVKADLMDVTAEQLSKHESYHHYLESDKDAKINRLRSRLKAKIGSKNYYSLLDNYMEIYAGSGMSDFDIEEEMLCDFNARINAFAKYDEKMPALKQAREAVIKEAGAEAEAEQEEYNSEMDDEENDVGEMRFSKELDAEYLELAKDEQKNYRKLSEMVSNAAKESFANPVMDAKGKLIDLYHGTSAFGFTEFDTENSISSNGLIYATNKNVVSANYGGRDKYAGVRRIGKKYIKNATSASDIIKNANSVYGTNYKILDDKTAETIKHDFVRKGTEYANLINKHWNDIEEIQNKYPGNSGTDYVISAIWTLEGSDLEDMTYDSLVEDAQWYNEHRDEAKEYFSGSDVRKYMLDNGMKELYSLFAGYELSDFMIDFESRFIPLFSESQLAYNESTGNVNTIEQLKNSTEATHNIGSYHLYGDLGNNPLTINADGRNWTNIKTDIIDDNEFGHSTDVIAKKAKNMGYTSVVIENVYDGGELANDYIFFNSEQLKSADPVTYDDEGNVIPLSERFNKDNSDIRYSRDIDDMIADMSIDELDAFLFEDEIEELKRTPSIDKSVFDLMDGLRNKVYKPAEKAPRRVDEVNKALKKMGMTYSGDRVIAWTDERLDKMLKAYGASNENYSRAYVTSINPIDFLKLTVGGNTNTLDWIVNGTNEYGDLDLGKLGDRPMFISANIRGKSFDVKGHEGRHRMLLLAKAGFKSVPVIVEDLETKYSKQPIDSIKFKPQWRDTSFVSRGREVVLNNLIPVNNKYKDEIQTAYGSKSNADVRFSRSFESIQELEDTVKDLKEMVKQLQNENHQNKKRYEYFKGQTRLTAYSTGNVKQSLLSEGSARYIANGLINKYGLTFKADEIINDLQELATRIATDKNAFDSIRGDMYGLSRKIVESATQVEDGGEKAILDDIRKTTIRIDQDVKSNFKDLDALSKTLAGKIKLSANKGMDVTDYYQTLTERFGESNFPSDIKSKADQLQRIIDTIEDFGPVVANPLNIYDRAEAIEGITMELFDILANANVAKPTMADKYNAKINKLKADNQTRINNLRQFAIEDRQSREKEINDIRKKREEIRRAEKNDYKARADLLKIAKRLDRMKTSAVNKAKLKELIGELDLVAVKMTNGKVQSALDVTTWFESQSNSNKEFMANTAAIKEMARLKLKSIGGKEAIIGRYETYKDALAAKKQYESEIDPNTNELANAGNTCRISKTANMFTVIATENAMDLNDVIRLTETLKTYETAIRNENKTIDTEDKRNVYEQSTEALANIKAAKGTKQGVYRNIDNLLITGTLSPARFFHRLANYNDSDPLYRAVVGHDGIEGGTLKTIDFQMRANRMFDEWNNDRKFTKQITGTKANVISKEIIDAAGNKVTIQYTPAMRMSLYLLSKNDASMRHMIGYDLPPSEAYPYGKHMPGGGITLPNMRYYLKGDANKAYEENAVTVRMTRKAINEIIREMSAEEKAYADRMSQFFNGMSQDAINEVSEKLNGNAIAKEENYFPINVNKDFLKKDYGAMQHDGTLPGMGSLQERMQNARQPIYLRDATTVLTQSIESTSKYYGLAIPISNFNKLINTQFGYTDADGNYWSNEESMSGIIKNKWGTFSTRYIDKFISDLQFPSGSTEDIENIFKKIKSNYVGAVLTLNGSVALKQAASYPTAAAILGWGPLVKAFKDFGHVDLNTIAKYTPLQYYRTKGFSTTELGDLKNQNSFWSNLPKGLNWIQGVDLLTTRKLWKASEIYVQENHPELYDKNTGKKYGRGGQSDEFYKAVAEVYNKVIEETQPNYTAAHRPHYLRTDSMFLQTLMMFKTQPFQNFNVLYDAIGNYAAKRAEFTNNSNDAEAKKALDTARKNLINAATSQIAAAAVFASMTFIWNMLRWKRDKYKDKDGNMTAESVAGTIGKDMVSSVTGMIPFGSNVYELVSSLWTGEKYYGMNDVSISAVNDLFTGLLSISKTAQNVITDVNNKEFDFTKYKKKFIDIASDVSKAFNVPFDNAYNLVNVIYKSGVHVATRATGEAALGEYMMAVFDCDPSNNKSEFYDILYKYYAAGDMESYEMVKQAMVSSGEFETKDKDAETAIKEGMQQKIMDNVNGKGSNKSQYYDYLYSIFGTDEFNAAIEDFAKFGASDESLNSGLLAAYGRQLTGITEDYKAEDLYSHLAYLKQTDASQFNEVIKTMKSLGADVGTINTGIQKAYGVQITGINSNDYKTSDLYDHLLNIYGSSEYKTETNYLQEFGVGADTIATGIKKAYGSKVTGIDVDKYNVTDLYDYIYKNNLYNSKNSELKKYGFSAADIASGMKDAYGRSVTGKSSNYTTNDLWSYLAKQSGTTLSTSINTLKNYGVSEDSIKSGIKKAWAASKTGTNIDDTKVGDVYAIMYKAYSSGSPEFSSMYQQAINVGYTASAIKEGIENLMKADYGVDNVKKLPTRFNPPSVTNPTWWTGESTAADNKKTATVNDSSWIGGISYDTNTAELTIIMNGSPHVFYNVPEEIYDGMKNAASKGGYYNDYIKGRY